MKGNKEVMKIKWSMVLLFALTVLLPLTGVVFKELRELMPLLTVLAIVCLCEGSKQLTFFKLDKKFENDSLKAEKKNR